MKKNLLFLLVFILHHGTSLFAQQTAANDDKIQWYSWNEAMALNKTQPRKLLIDVYTDWCGWCKVMDKQTFPDAEITNYLNKNFYCIKLNAEMRDTIEFSGNKFAWVSPEQGGGRNGIHTLAYSLLDGNMSYPTIVYLTEKLERVSISPGYKKPAQLMPELKFTGEEFYKTKNFNDYMKSSEKGN